ETRHQTPPVTRDAMSRKISHAERSRVAPGLRPPTTGAEHADPATTSPRRAWLGPPPTGAEHADPVTTSPGRAWSQATPEVDRPRGARYNGRRVPERAVLPRGLAPDLASVRVADGRGERRRVDRRGRGARGRRADPRCPVRVRPPLDRARPPWLPGDGRGLQR